MSRIGITQRVELIPSYGERRDCLDQQWFVLLEQLDLQPVPIPNNLDDPAAWARALGLAGLVLSGGNDPATLAQPANPAPERDRTERALLKLAAEARWPVLGVCRGMQMMNLHLGGQLGRIEGHIACRHRVQPLAEHPLLNGYAEVNSFHGWAIPRTQLAPPLEALLGAAGDTVEALRHRRLPWLGIMWHPEREAPFCPRDKRLIQGLFSGSFQ